MSCRCEALGVQSQNKVLGKCYLLFIWKGAPHTMFSRHFFTSFFSFIHLILQLVFFSFVVVVVFLFTLSLSYLSYIYRERENPILKGFLRKRKCLNCQCPVIIRHLSHPPFVSVLNHHSHNVSVQGPVSVSHARDVHVSCAILNHTVDAIVQNTQHIPL